MRKLKFVLGALVLALLLSAPAAPAQAEDVLVSAAGSLTNAFDVLKKTFEAAHPGVTVVTNYGASGALLKQMESGAPVDVFASADQKTMDQAVAKKLVNEATRRNFVRNGLVLIVPLDSKLALAGERDLARPGVARIALGNPEIVPAGRYAKESLELAGMWGELTQKYIFGNTVRQVLDYVARGEVDAAIVFSTDAMQARAKVRVVKELATKTPALYPVAVTTSGTKPAARAFVDFLLSAEGQRILGTFGFQKR